MESQWRRRRLFALLRLAEGNPESVAIADDEFTHTVKRVMQVLDDFNFAVDVASQRIDVVNMRIEIDFASAAELGLPPAFNITSLCPSRNNAQSISPASHSRLTLRISKPTEAYHSPVAQRWARES
jgi:hypothetical protein